jgi:hypothetical protein
VVGVDLKVPENDHQKVVKRIVMVHCIVAMKRMEVEVAHLWMMMKRSKGLS